eukprot:2976565-Rhodomonas_salina.1
MELSSAYKDSPSLFRHIRGEVDMGAKSSATLRCALREGAHHGEMLTVLPVPICTPPTLISESVEGAGPGVPMLTNTQSTEGRVKPQLPATVTSPNVVKSPASNTNS